MLYWQISDSSCFLSCGAYLQFLHWYAISTLVEILVISHVILATLLLPINHHTKMIDVANCTAINLHYYSHFIALWAETWNDSVRISISQMDLLLSYAHLLASTKILNVATSVSGMFCMLVAIVIFVILVHYKVYNTTLQRLFLLLIIATILFEADMAMMIEHLFQYSGQEEFCAVLGYFNQSMSCMVFFFTAEIAVYLLFMVYKNVRGNPLPRLSKSKCLSRSVECISCLAPVLLPMAYALFPYERFGLSLFNCWMKTYDDACNKIGSTYQTITFCVLWGLKLCQQWPCAHNVVLCSLLDCFLWSKGAWGKGVSN